MARHALPGHFVLRMNMEKAMNFRLFAVTTAALALAVAGCNKTDTTNGVAPYQPAQAA